MNAGTSVTNENDIHNEIGKEVKEVLVLSVEMVSSCTFSILLKTVHHFTNSFVWF
jgi:hypothetical protein